MCGFVVPLLDFLFLYMMYVTVNLSHISCIAYILLQILSEMKLRFGIDIEVVLRASITDRAANIVNKVASLKKNLDEEAAGLIAAARGEPDPNKQKGNDYFALFFLLIVLRAADLF